MSKKLIIILILILLVSGIGGYAYYKLFIFTETPSPLEVVPKTKTSDSSTQIPSTTNQNSSTTTTSSSVDNTTPDIQVIASNSSDLVQITTEPISGAIIINNGSSTVIRYNDRKTGHIFDVNTATFTQNRISNTTLPKIYESVWLAGGKQSVLRYFDEENSVLQSYLVTINPSSSASSTIVGTYLPENISTVAFSPSSSQIFYILPSTEGVEGVVYTNSNKKSVAFQSAISEWTTSWPNSTTISLTTKPAAGVLGSLYFLNPQKNSVSEVLSNIKGLTTLTNPSGSKVLFSDDTASIFIFDVKGKKTSNLNLTSFPEKCVWSKEGSDIYCGGSFNIQKGSYPDDWYQGTVSFGDDIYKIDTTTNKAEMFINLHETYKKYLDIINPDISKDGKYLIFTNKTDGSLWSLKIK